MNTRRKTILALGAGTLANALATSLPAFAQPPAKAEKIWRVGVLIARAWRAPAATSPAPR